MSTQGTIKRYTLIIQRITGVAYSSFNDLKNFLSDHGFEISPRTLQRDIEQIRNEFGIEISYNRSRNSYMIADESSLPSDTLIRFLEILGTAELFHENFKDEKDLLNYISFEDQGSLLGIDNLRLLLPAILKKRKIKFSHENFETGIISKYAIRPYLLREYQSRWYVIGTVGTTNDFRTFGLDRITDIIVTKESFKHIKGIDPKSFFENIVGLVYSQSELSKVLMKVTPFQMKYLKSLPLHKSQQVVKQTDKYFLLQFLIQPNYEFTQKVMMLGWQATVIEPSWLVKDIKLALTKTLKNYS